MQKIAMIATLLFSLSSLAATDSMKFKLPAPTNSVTSVEQTSTMSYGTTSSYSNDDLRAVVLTNVDQLAKSGANISVNMMMNEKAGMSLGYASTSQKEKREKVNNADLTVDRSTIAVGAAFYVWDLESQKNISLVPALLFRTEKDAVNTETDTGVGLKAVGVFKPMARVLFEAGVNGTLIDGDSKGEAYLGLGFIF